MNFFRSEEHLRNWEGFTDGKIGGMISLDSLMRLFSGPYFQRRLDLNYMSHYGEYMEGMMAALDGLKDAGSYWRLGPLEKAGFSLGRKIGLL